MVERAWVLTVFHYLQLLLENNSCQKKWKYHLNTSSFLWINFLINKLIFLIGVWNCHGIVDTSKTKGPSDFLVFLLRQTRDRGAVVRRCSNIVRFAWQPTQYEHERHRPLPTAHCPLANQPKLLEGYLSEHRLCSATFPLPNKHHIGLILSSNVVSGKDSVTTNNQPQCCLYVATQNIVEFVFSLLAREQYRPDTEMEACSALSLLWRVKPQVCVLLCSSWLFTYFVGCFGQRKTDRIRWLAG